MSFSDPLGDMLTRIRNGQQARKSDIKVPASKLREPVLDVLKRDKLVVPGNGGNCESDRPCGYVTTGTHQNNTTDKIWLKISKCTGSGTNITCE